MTAAGALASLPLPSLLAAPALRKRAKLQWGCAAITWQGHDHTAIEEVAQLGYRGIQLRANVIDEFGTQPQTLRDLLAQHHLQMPVFSSGTVRCESLAGAQQEIALHTEHARFVKQMGGQYLQVVEFMKPSGDRPTDDDFRLLSDTLNTLGKRCADEGVTLVLHNHMGSLAEAPENFDRLWSRCDASVVKILLDVAHYQQGGGDPVEAIAKYAPHIALFHIKDVRPVLKEGQYTYEFVELGQGQVDLPAVFEAIDEFEFNGWAIVELDRVPQPNQTPYAAQLISKTYLQKTLKRKF